MNITPFINGLTQRLNEYKASSGYTYFKEYKVIATEAKKYFKVYRVEVQNDGKDGSPHILAFVDKTTGDIFKPATYKAPAKHARGNVLSNQNGMEAIDRSGFVHYLK
jgi:hypothetical protein